MTNIELLGLVNEGLRDELMAHAAREAPRECCGLLVRIGDQVVYRPAANLHTGAAGFDRFLLDPMDRCAAEEEGVVEAIVHSHPNASANPSQADRVGCEASGLPWLIVGWPSGVVKALRPEGWRAPLLGREFHHGVLDCYTEIQDWYLRKLNIALPDFDREDDWWVRTAEKLPQDLYMANYKAAGFVPSYDAPRPHDVIAMQVCADVANHGAIYLGNGTMLHHLFARLSCTDVYGNGRGQSYWERHTVALLRHHTLLDVTLPVATVKAGE